MNTINKATYPIFWDSLDSYELQKISDDQRDLRDEALHYCYMARHATQEVKDLYLAIAARYTTKLQCIEKYMYSRGY